VVLVTLEHHDAVFYGKNFADTMESEVDSIRGAMHDPYEQGHYAEAIVTALHDSSEVIKGNSNPATETGGLPDWAWVLIILVGCAILIGVVVALVRGGGRGGGGGYGTGGRSGYRSSGAGGSTFFYGSSDSGGGGGFSCGGGGSSGTC
jgi:uncharacterized protein